MLIKTKAWNVAHNSDETAFTVWNRDPQKAADFGVGMSYWSTAPGFEAHHICDQFDFSSLPSPATFVDMGGSVGDACIEIAFRYATIQCIVQDLPSTIDGIPHDKIPSQIKDRIRFMKHDFFKEQPVHGAEIYHFRAVLHDWPDESCVMILRNLIPALKKGSIILVSDTVMPRFGDVSMAELRRLR